MSRTKNRQKVRKSQVKVVFGAGRALEGSTGIGIELQDACSPCVTRSSRRERCLVRRFALGAIKCQAAGVKTTSQNWEPESGGGAAMATIHVAVGRLAHSPTQVSKAAQAFSRGLRDAAVVPRTPCSWPSAGSLAFRLVIGVRVAMEQPTELRAGQARRMAVMLKNPLFPRWG
jgi:hypothetical protein